MWKWNQVCLLFYYDLLRMITEQKQNKNEKKKKKKEKESVREREVSNRERRGERSEVFLFNF